LVFWLSIKAKDGVWHFPREVDIPIAVRYAYTNRPEGSLLCSRAGMPVGLFSTIGYGSTYPEVGEGKRTR